MSKFYEVKLTDAARSKIVLLYIGCKLQGIDIKNINNLANQLILSGATGKKITFANDRKIYEAQELIDFAYDYIYAEMKRVLYKKGKLNTEFIESAQGTCLEKAVFLCLINRIFDFDFLNEIEDRDVYDALTLSTLVWIGEHHTISNIPDYIIGNRHTDLIKTALSEYKTHLDS